LPPRTICATGEWIGLRSGPKLKLPNGVAKSLMPASVSRMVFGSTLSARRMAVANSQTAV